MAKRGPKPKEKRSGIYCIENICNGKKYIGKDKNIYKNTRWYGHRSGLRRNAHKNSHLQNAWNLYGEINFVYSVLEYCSTNDLSKKEIYYIKEYDTTNPDVGYNLTKGGDGNNGWVPSELTKSRISESHMGEKNPNWGKTLNEKQRKAITRYGEDNYNFGRHWSDEMKQYFSECNSGPNSPRFAKKNENRTSKFYGVIIYHSKQIKNGILYEYTYWKPQLRVKGKTIRPSGYFKTEEEAARIYDKFVIKNNLPNPLNFPEKYVNGVYNG